GGRGYDVDPPAAFIEGTLPINQRKQRPIPPGADVASGEEFSAPLADNNAARGHEFTTKTPDAQPFADAVPPIPNTALTFLMCHNLSFNFADFYPCQFLPVPYRPMVPFAAFHFERDFLFTAEVFENIDHNAGLGNRGRADADFTLVLDQEHPVQGKRLASLSFQTVDFQGLARSDTILFPASFNHCIHNLLLYFPKGRVIAPKTPTGVNPSFWCMIRILAVALFAASYMPKLGQLVATKQVGRTSAARQPG